LCREVDISKKSNAIQSNENDEGSIENKLIWPAPLSEDAFYGLAGQIVRSIYPETEADIAALLFQFLVFVGNIIGHTARFNAENTDHYCNLFVALVGATCKGGKGSSLKQIKQLFKNISPQWSKSCIDTNCSTGEGIVARIKDDQYESKEILDKDGNPTGEYEDKIVCCGAIDKRLLLIEQEFSSFLKLASREGNTLSPTIRQAWDSEKLGHLIKKDRITATDAHISMICHISKTELLKLLSETEQANGFANRYLWVCVKRSKHLPFGGKQDSVPAELLVKLEHTLANASKLGNISFDEEAAKLWAEVYMHFDDKLTNLTGAICSRSAPQTRRLATIYAVLDCSPVITINHLKAALELWRYNVDSVGCIFGNMSGNPNADKIREFLSDKPDGASLSEINSCLFKGNKKSQEIKTALKVLADSGVISFREIETNGRPEIRWCLC
jgi:hypothetical protein